MNFPDSLFGLIALMAAAKGTLLTMTISSCLTFGKIRQHLPSTFLTRLLPNCCAPWVAITATLLACAVLAVVGNLQVSAKTVVLMLMRIFFITSVAALVLHKNKVAHRHFQVRLIVPVASIASCILLLTQQNAQVWAFGAGFLIVGQVLYMLAPWAARRVQVTANFLTIARNAGLPQFKSAPR